MIINGQVIPEKLTPEQVVEIISKTRLYAWWEKDHGMTKEKLLAIVKERYPDPDELNDFIRQALLQFHTIFGQQGGKQ